VIYNIAAGSADVMKGLCNHEGLIALLVAVVGKEEVEWKVVRENALDVIHNISVGNILEQYLCEYEVLIADRLYKVAPAIAIINMHKNLLLAR